MYTTVYHDFAQSTSHLKCTSTTTCVQTRDLVPAQRFPHSQNTGFWVFLFFSLWGWGAWGVQLFGPLLSGIPLVVAPPTLLTDPSSFWAVLRAARVTRLVAVPTSIRMWLPELADNNRVSDVLF